MLWKGCGESFHADIQVQNKWWVKTVVMLVHASCGQKKQIWQLSGFAGWFAKRKERSPSYLFQVSWTQGLVWRRLTVGVFYTSADCGWKSFQIYFLWVTKVGSGIDPVMMESTKTWSACAALTMRRNHTGLSREYYNWVCFLLPPFSFA